MTTGRFRLLVVSWFVVDVWWFAIPFGAYNRYPEYAHEAFRYSGRGALITPSEDIWWAFLVAEFVVAIGLFGFYNWARHLLFVTTLAHVAIRPLLGLGVSTPFVGMLGHGLVLLNGVILAACYSSPLADAFLQTDEQDEETSGVDESESESEEQLVCVFESSNAAVIPVVASLLDASGIAYETNGGDLQDIIAGGRLAGFNQAAGPVRFLVNSSQSEAARAVLESTSKEPPDELGPAPANSV